MLLVWDATLNQFTWENQHERFRSRTTSSFDPRDAEQMLNDIVHNQELSDQGRQGRALKKALGSVSNIGEMLY